MHKPTAPNKDEELIRAILIIFPSRGTQDTDVIPCFFPGIAGLSIPETACNGAYVASEWQRAG
jgi:hypothetical protein